MLAQEKKGQRSNVIWITASAWLGALKPRHACFTHKLWQHTIRDGIAYKGKQEKTTVKTGKSAWFLSSSVPTIAMAPKQPNPTPESNNQGYGWGKIY